jgi:hypothetical protein
LRNILAKTLDKILHLPKYLCAYSYRPPTTMKFLTAMLVLTLQAAGSAWAVLHLEQYTHAPGHVSHPLDPRTILDMPPHYPRAADEAIELDPATVSAAIAPEDNPDGQLRARDRLGRRDCPNTAPWLCEGVTCINRLSHMCCKGGWTCKYPQLCIRNRIGLMTCK